jgi:hypothetical protein
MNIFHFASTYLVPLISVLAFRYGEWMFPLALVVCVYGTTETFLRDDLGWLVRLLAVFLHAVPPAVCCRNTNPRVTFLPVLLCVGVLLAILGLFVQLSHWPYVIPHVPSVFYVVGILFVAYVAR